MINNRIILATALFCAISAVPHSGEAQAWGSLSASNMRGVVLSFDRNKCPKGWEEYVALRGRGVVGVNPANPGNAPVNQLPKYDLATDYGTPTVTLSVGQLPPHTHPYNDIYYSEASGPSEGGPVQVPGGYGSKSTDTDNRGLQIARITGSTGEGKPVPIQPPVRALLFCKLL